MIFTETKLAGAFIIDLARLQDDRGFFARLFCQRELAAQRLRPSVAQAIIGANRRRGPSGACTFSSRQPQKQNMFAVSAALCMMLL